MDTIDRRHLGIFHSKHICRNITHIGNFFIDLSKKFHLLVVHIHTFRYQEIFIICIFLILQLFHQFYQRLGVNGNPLF